MKYVPALDGLRAIAMLAVLAYHAGAPFAGGAFIGVDLFFVLSGFLITTLLVAEHREHGRIEVLRFYWRRALRLYPTLLMMLAGFLLVAPHVWPELPAWRYAMWSALYLSDYSRAFLGEPIVLSYTWSLSVEEHFYLLWPLLLPLVLRTSSPIRTLLIAYIAATAWRMGNYIWLGWDATYFRFDTRLSGLILGCLIALWHPKVDRRAWPALAILALLAAIPTDHTWSGMTIMLPLAEASAAMLIIACITAPHQMTWAAFPPLTYLGRLSYGMYIWHFPMIYWLRDHYSWPVALAGAGVFAFVMAAATYHLVDLPIRRLRGVRRQLPISA